MRRSTQKKQSDIERILFGRGQEDLYDTETLYVVFSELEPECTSELRRKTRVQSWHLMNLEKRIEFLRDWLPEFEGALLVS